MYGYTDSHFKYIISFINIQYLKNIRIGQNVPKRFKVKEGEKKVVLAI